MVFNRFLPLEKYTVRTLITFYSPKNMFYNYQINLFSWYVVSKVYNLLFQINYATDNNYVIIDDYNGN